MFYILGIILGSLLDAPAQDNTKLNNSEILDLVDELARPPGGLPSYYKWIGENIHYPKSARRKNKQGKVFVKFVVEMSGEITNVNVTKGFDSECDQEAARVVSISSKWQPAMKGGRVVRSAYTLPITFKLKGWSLF